MSFPVSANGAKIIDNLFGTSINGYLQDVAYIYAYVAATGTWLYCLVTHTGSGESETWHCGGTLTSMIDGVGYWVYVTTGFAVTWVGWVVSPTIGPPSYSLAKGWNLMGYRPTPNPNNNSTVGTYLNSVSGHYDLTRVWVFDVNGTWYHDNGTGNTVLDATFGMWVYMTSAATLYP